MTDFDVEAEAQRLQAHTQTIRKKRYAPSRLDRYQGELLQLHRHGVTTAQLQRWLRAKRIKVAWSTVSRWLQKHG
ncbi:MAG TPA: hypothetical protein P5032_14895 [Candidatus Competibacter sp.]|nr:hypothetical protein [Candidatus Competibacter sp.]